MRINVIQSKEGRFGQRMRRLEIVFDSVQAGPKFFDLNGNQTDGATYTKLVDLDTDDPWKILTGYELQAVRKFMAKLGEQDKETLFNVLIEWRSR